MPKTSSAPPNSPSQAKHGLMQLEMQHSPLNKQPLLLWSNVITVISLVNLAYPEDGSHPITTNVIRTAYLILQHSVGPPQNAKNYVLDFAHPACKPVQVQPARGLACTCHCKDSHPIYK